MSVWAVVPVRQGGRRLPGKALAPIAGVPLFVHVARAAARAPVDRVVVATDAPTIVDVARSSGLEVVSTGPQPCGTHRVWAALAEVAGPRPEAVVNVQGDQPLLNPAHVHAALSQLGSFDVGTVSAPLADGAPSSRVKVVAAPSGRALYFSRAPIPHGGPYRVHVGIYAFHLGTLERCVAAPRGGLAELEDLEQLAWLEAGISIGVACVAHAEAPVDEEGDLARVRAQSSG